MIAILKLRHRVYTAEDGEERLFKSSKSSVAGPKPVRGGERHSIAALTGWPIPQPVHRQYQRESMALTIYVFSCMNRHSHRMALLRTRS